MTFADLFAPFPDPPAIQPGRADSADKAIPTLKLVGNLFIEEERKERDHISKESGLGLSALSAPALVPLDTPFVEGQRYQLAGATELRTRLDCYLADPAGPWIRLHGVLMVAPSTR